MIANIVAICSSSHIGYGLLSCTDGPAFSTAALGVGEEATTGGVAGFLSDNAGFVAELGGITTAGDGRLTGLLSAGRLTELVLEDDGALSVVVDVEDDVVELPSRASRRCRI